MQSKVVLLIPVQSLTLEFYYFSLVLVKFTVGSARVLLLDGLLR